MTPRPRIIRLHTSNPALATLRVMGKNANDAARTWTLREWTARLATKAPPRDYVGQLREVYNGIIKRWRYVQEPGEWTHGKPETLLGYTLGANYNRGKTCPDPLRCDVEATPWKEFGWGDCDDVAQLAGAAALAIGMPEVRWRVARWPTGAHVSAIVRTPTGEWVSVDPVGHPKHPFGWALDPRAGGVSYFHLDGRPAQQPRGRGNGATTMAQTFLSGPEGQSSSIRHSPHVVLTHPGDNRGARTLGLPLWHHRIMSRGAVLDGTPAVDQYGEQYEYAAPDDMWVPMSGWFKRMRRKMKKRWARRRKKVRRLFKRTRVGRAMLRAGKRIRKGVRKVAKAIGRSRVFKFLRKAKARILGSKVVQAIASTALQAFGVPRAATRAVLAREAKIAKMGGRAKLVELLAAGKRKEAAKFMMKSLKAAGKGAIPPALRAAMRAGRKIRRRLSGPEESDSGLELVMVQDGAMYTVAPVEEMTGLRGVVELGQLETLTTVEPGTFYKIQKGDTLLGIGQLLNDGKRSGGPLGSRLKAAKLINDSAYNQRYHRPSKEGFERQQFGSSIISLNPKSEWDGYATIWIAPAPGVEPPEKCPQGSEFDPDTRQCVTLPEPEPPEPPPEPDEPDEPEAPPVSPLPPVVPELPPEPVPPAPTPPVVPTPAPTTCGPGYTLVQGPQGAFCRRGCPPGTVISPRADPMDPAPACVPGQAPPTPEPPPAPTPPIAPVPPAPVPPVAPTPTDCPPGTVWSVQGGRCIRVISPPDIPEPEPPLPPVAPPVSPPWQPGAPPPSPGAGAGGGRGFPWLALLALIGAS